MRGRDGRTRNIPLRLVCFEHFFVVTVLVCDGFGDDILIVVVISVVVIGIINIFLARGLFGLAGSIYHMPHLFCFPAAAARGFHLMDGCGV